MKTVFDNKSFLTNLLPNTSQTNKLLLQKKCAIGISCVIAAFLVVVGYALKITSDKLNIANMQLVNIKKDDKPPENKN